MQCKATYISYFWNILLYLTEVLKRVLKNPSLISSAISIIMQELEKSFHVENLDLISSKWTYVLAHREPKL